MLLASRFTRRVYIESKTGRKRANKGKCHTLHFVWQWQQQQQPQRQHTSPGSQHLVYDLAKNGQMLSMQHAPYENIIKHRRSNNKTTTTKKMARKLKSKNSLRTKGERTLALRTFIPKLAYKPCAQFTSHLQPYFQLWAHIFSAFICSIAPRSYIRHTRIFLIFFLLTFSILSCFVVGSFSFARSQRQRS